MTLIMRDDFRELCRLCANKKKSKLNIFKAEGERRQLPVKIRSCLSVQVSRDDDLPNFICHRCIQKLDTFYSFKVSCLLAEDTLRSYVKASRVVGKDGLETIEIKEEICSEAGDEQNCEDFENQIARGETCHANGTNSTENGEGSPKTDTPQSSANAKVSSGVGNTSELPAGSSKDATESPTQQRRTSRVRKPTLSPNFHYFGLEKEDSDPTWTIQQERGQPAPAPKRKRGRPPKPKPVPFLSVMLEDNKDIDLSALVNSNSVEVKPVIAEAPPVKRKRGRPPKPKPLLTPEVEKAIEENKDIDLALLASMEVIQSPKRTSEPPKKRGRPPKEKIIIDPKILKVLEVKRKNPIKSFWPPRQKEALTCDVCGKSFNLPIVLQLHKRVHTGQKPHACSMCGKTFIAKLYLLKHLRFHLRQIPFVFKTSSGDDLKLPLRGFPISSNVFECQMCDKKFICKAGLLSHIRSHSTLVKMHTCPLCGNSYRKKDHYNRHMRTHTGEKPYPCQICGRAFPRKDRLMRHISSHFGKEHFLCRICGKAFLSSEELMSHSSTHTGEEPLVNPPNTLDILRSLENDFGGRNHMCDRCGMSFYTKAELDSHNKTHSQYKPFSCGKCGKAFSRKTHLVRHEESHLGIRPYPCQICGRAFTRKDHLMKHYLIHTGEKKFPCDSCDQSFTRRDLLKAHKKRHTDDRPFMCVLCNKTFRDSGSLRIHIRLHTGERPYTCTICGKGLISSSSLSMHLKHHAGIKNYKCEVCDMSFVRKNDLQRHHRRRHSAKDERLIGHSISPPPLEVELEEGIDELQPEEIAARDMDGFTVEEVDEAEVITELDNETVSSEGVNELQQEIQATT